MNKIVLMASVVVLSLGIVNDAKSGCHYSGYLGGKCYTWNPGVENNCGEGCTYTYENGTVYVKASGANANVDMAKFTPISYENNRIPVAINNFIIEGPISLGEKQAGNIFTRLDWNQYTISGANGNLILTGIGHHAFGENAYLSGNIIITADAEFGSLAFHGVTLASDAKIYCAVENCAQKMIDSCNAHVADAYRSRCLSAVNTIVSTNKLKQAPENCVLFSANGCLKCKNSNFKLNDGECDRLRWTPAEAAKVLHDDNTNEITITFKK